MSFKHVLGMAFALITVLNSAHGQHPPGCMAYLHNDEIHVRCGGAVRVLLRRPGLVQYAINSHFTALLLLEHVTRDHVTVDTQKVVLLSGSKEKVANMPYGATVLYASCGTILAGLSDKRNTTWDVVAGKPVTFTSLQRPVCSADRSRVVGINSSGQLVESSGAILAQPGQFDPFAYAISQSGNTIALLRGSPVSDRRLCVRSGNATPEHCYTPYDTVWGGISVDDSGRTLFTQGIAQTCYYVHKKMTAKKVPGAPADQCFAVILAAPDSPTKLVALLGDHPSWISPGEKGIGGKFKRGTVKQQTPAGTRRRGHRPA